MPASEQREAATGVHGIAGDDRPVRRTPGAAVLGSSGTTAPRHSSPATFQARMPGLDSVLIGSIALARERREQIGGLRRWRPAAPPMLSTTASTAGRSPRCLSPLHSQSGASLEVGNCGGPGQRVPASGRARGGAVRIDRRACSVCPADSASRSEAVRRTGARALPAPTCDTASTTPPRDRAERRSLARSSAPPAPASPALTASTTDSMASSRACSCRL